MVHRQIRPRRLIGNLKEEILAENIVSHDDAGSVRILKLDPSSPIIASIIENGIIDESYILNRMHRYPRLPPGTYFQTIGPVVINDIVLDPDVFKKAPILRSERNAGTALMHDVLINVDIERVFIPGIQINTGSLRPGIVNMVVIS